MTSFKHTIPEVQMIGKDRSEMADRVFRFTKAVMKDDPVPEPGLNMGYEPMFNRNTGVWEEGTINAFEFTFNNPFPRTYTMRRDVITGTLLVLNHWEKSGVS